MTQDYAVMLLIVLAAILTLSWIFLPFLLLRKLSKIIKLLQTMQPPLSPAAEPSPVPVPPTEPYPTSTHKCNLCDYDLLNQSECPACGATQ